MRQAGRPQPHPAAQALPEAGWTKRLGLGLPFATSVVVCLWFDVFGLRTEPRLLQVAQPAADTAEAGPRPCPEAKEPRGEAEDKACKSLKSALEAESSVDAGVAWLAGLPDGTCDARPAAARTHGGAGRKSPRVGASIALHPPKFYSMGMFLQQYSACPAAMEALSIFVVFSNEQDLRLFEAGMRCRHPGVPREAWRAVVAVEPDMGWQSLDPGPTVNQKIAAYKKWHGLLHMMDLGTSAPEYGVMLDGELLLYANAGEGPHPAKDCGAGSPWAELFGRIRAREEAKLWPAAVVSPTLITYDFGAFTKSGQDYDRAIIEENSRWVGLSGCGEGAGCQLVRQQISKCLYSWWTDLPWVRLSTAAEMLLHLFLSDQGLGEGGWRAAAAGMRFERFEHIGYQQWCVMHRGFQFRDVTNITGFAKWGSYSEDPVEGSRLGELEPLWVSGQALQRAEEGKIAALAEVRPPLLIFHADQGRPRSEREHSREDWRITLKGIMQLRGISHPYAHDL